MMKKNNLAVIASGTSKWRGVLIFILVASLLTGCAPGATTREGRINRIEAFLVDRYNGYRDITPPNISVLSDAERMTIVNGLSFDVVSGKEDILIEYLDAQWPTWRSGDGFMLEHLDCVVALAEKSVAQMVDGAFEAKQAGQYATLQALCDQIEALLLERYDEVHLYLIKDSFECNWQLRESALHLQSARFNLADLKTGAIYGVAYDSSEIALKQLNMELDLYGHLELSEALRTVDERQLMPLYTGLEGTVLSVSLRLQDGRYEGDLSALKRIDDYRAVQSVDGVEQVGRLTINRQLNEVVDVIAYALYTVR